MRVLAADVARPGHFAARAKLVQDSSVPGSLLASADSKRLILLAVVTDNMSTSGYVMAGLKLVGAKGQSQCHFMMGPAHAVSFLSNSLTQPTHVLPMRATAP